MEAARPPLETTSRPALSLAKPSTSNLVSCQQLSALGLGDVDRSTAARNERRLRRAALSLSLPNVEERGGATGMRKIGTKTRKKKRSEIPKKKTMKRAKARRGRHSARDHLLGEAHQAMTQKAEVTAPIRLISPTTLELNQMAEAREVESANHRQLVSRTRETLKNLTSLDSLHSHRHNCGALGVCSISPTSKAFPTPRKTRYSSTC